MPSTAKVSFEARYRVLKKLPIFYPNGELKPESNYVWAEAARNLNSDIIIHNLYLSVQQDRRNLLSALKVNAGIVTNKVKFYDIDSSDESNISDSETNEFDSDIDFEFDRLNVADKNPYNCSPFNFDIDLNASEYSKIKPIEVVYKNNPYPVQRLKYGWADVFVRKICSSTRLKCVPSLKKQTVYTNHDYPFFDFYGHCRVCGTYIYGHCDRKFANQTKNKNIVVHIKTFDTTSIPHKGKRFLKGLPLRKARKTLKFMKASRYRTHVADNYFKFGDPEPVDLQTTVNLRKARERAIDRELDMKGPKDIYSSLKYQANLPDTSIRQLQEYPFVVKFQSDNQIAIWKKIAQTGWFCISIDASGSFIKTVRTPNHETSYILYYASITILNNKIVPLQQMISEKHDTNIIKMWLSDAVRAGAPIPDEVVTDGSLALLGAVSLSYNKCTYRSSLENGFQYALCEMIRQPFETQLVRTWIRQDRAHILKACARWTCFKKTSYATKDFYLRVIGYSVEIESLKLLEKVLFAIFLLSETLYIIQNTESERQLQWLMDRIKSFSRDSVHEILREPAETDSKTMNYKNDIEFQEIVTENDINAFIQAVQQKAKNSCSNELTDDAMSNVLHCPAIKDNIFYLYAQAPAWTNLLSKAYDSPNVKAVSAGSEANFKNLKNLDWVSYPISANKFIKNQERQIEAAISFAQSYLMDKEVQEKYESAKNQTNSKVLGVQKNAIPTTTHQLSNKVPLKQFIGENVEKPANKNQLTREMNGDTVTKSRNDDSADEIIINGNLKKHPVIIKEEEQIRFYYTIHTCPVDSLIEICSFSYETYENFQMNALDRIKNNEFLKAIISYNNDNFSKSLIYQKRAKLMKPISRDVNGSIINCQYNVSELLEKMFSDQPLIRRTVSCTNCEFTGIDGYTTAILPISEVNNFRNQGMCSLQRYLNLHFTYGNMHCSSCKTQGRKNFYVIDFILALNLEYLFLNDGKVTQANQIPTSLIVQSKTYKLAGVVCFIELYNINLPLHYYACLFKNGKWETRNDLLNRIDTTKNLPRDVKISLVIYVVD